MKNFLAKFKNPTVIRIAIGVLLFMLLSGGYLFYQFREGRVEIEDSLIEAPVISVAPRSSGRLISLIAHRGEFVTKGQALAVVDSDTIRADSDGIVTGINQDVGSSVSPQAPIMQLINPNHLRATGTIDENKGLNLIKIGQAASFTVDAFPGKTFWGYVDAISESAKQTQAAFSISSQRPTQQFEVYVNYNTRKYPRLKDGMSARITVYTN
ncbi:efflux RND transporter periplasmic adaptor subunit [Patescibacteria group bacterium]|nr:efflux RND transporter periplasmic adaptor subunit [Patescibacteria group bacterium]